MFTDIFPDLLRGTTSIIFLMLLLPILSKHKLKPWHGFWMMVIVLVLNAGVFSQLYITRNYTGAVYYSLAFYVVIICGIKLLLKDALFQWLFSSVTVLNAYAIIVIASFYLCYLFPHPEYANTIIRIILFLATILFFKRWLRPLYLEVSENWGAFLLPISSLLIGYLYILLSLGDVELSMSLHIHYFYLLTIITIMSYIAILFSLKSLRANFLLRAENIKSQANALLLKSEIAAYETTLNLAKQTKHDIRHHNAIIAEYLNGEDLDGAKSYLSLYDQSIQDHTYRAFSKNPTANAVFRIYERRARQHDIEFLIQAQADHHLKPMESEMGIILSNIFENAFYATKECQMVPRYIHYTSTVLNESLLIEIKNSFEGVIDYEHGLPKTTKKDGGTGLKSVMRMVEKHHGMFQIHQDHQVFSVQIIFPIQNP